MNATKNRQRTSAAPSKTALVALTLAVLVGHWLALGGRLPLWTSGKNKTRSTMDALPTPVVADAVSPNGTLPQESPPAAPKPVSTTTVRWIAPPAPPPPPPPPPKPKPKPKPKPVVREAPTPPPAAPAPSLSNAIEALGPPIAPLSIEEIMEDFAADVPPEPETPTAAPPPAALPAPEAAEPSQPATALAAQPTDLPVASPPVGPDMPEGSLPANATLSYDVKGRAKGFNYSASGTLVWQQTGNTYEADLEISAFLLGSFQRISTGLITAQGLVPQRFVDRRRSKEKSAVFDRAANVIRYSAKTPDAALLPGAQDQLSVMLQLAGLLNASQQRNVGDVISVPVSSDTDAEIWHFEIGPFETLNLPAGDVPARRLIRLPRKPNDKTVEVWLAPNLGRLPVRMRLTEPNGDFMDQLLEALPEVAPQATPATDETRSVP